MLWYKNWLECKFRVWLCVFLTVSVVVMCAASAKSISRKVPAAAAGQSEILDRLRTEMPKAGVPQGEAAVWKASLDLLAGVVLPVSALILAGSGLNTQTNWGMTHGYHASMYFVLGLPVRRARLLWSRVAMGWVLLVGLVLASIFGLLILTPMLGTPLDWPLGMKLIPYLIAGCTLYFAFATWLCVFLDEFWSGIVGLTITGLITGYSLAGGPGWIAVVNFMEGQTLLKYGAAGWGQGFFYLGLSAVMLGAAQYQIERKEF
jgi:hypothetical protein